MNMPLIQGQKFGRWTVLETFRKDVSYPSCTGTRLYAKCKCDCGTERDISANNLLRGKTKSCGCFFRESLKNRTRGTHLMSYSRLYRIWADMKSRCLNPNTPNYCNYGEKGITIVNEWIDNFVNFQTWSLEHGYSDSLTLDRRDNRKGYSPENCRWVTNKEQCRNRKTNKIVKITDDKGCVKTIGLADAADLYRKSLDLVRNRLSLGWDVMKALKTPVRPYQKKEI